MTTTTSHSPSSTRPKGTNVPTKIPNAIAYKGDDWAQNMARTMALPILAMGLMAVAGGLVAGINFGDFFSPSGDLADLGRAEATVQIAGASLFLGMGLILAGITVVLVNVVRDAGRDVQHSLGTEALQLRKPLTGKLTPHVMMMGVMIELVAFVLGLIAAVHRRRRCCRHRRSRHGQCRRSGRHRLRAGRQRLAPRAPTGRHRHHPRIHRAHPDHDPLHHPHPGRPDHRARRLMGPDSMFGDRTHTATGRTT